MQYITLLSAKDIVMCLQEPYITRKGLPRLPRGYEGFWKDGVGVKPRAAVIAPKALGGYLVTQNSDRDCITVRFLRDTLSVISLYCDGLRSVQRAWDMPRRECSHSDRILVCADANATHSLWGGGRGHKRGRIRGGETVEILDALGLHVCNTEGSVPTFIGPAGRSSHIDITCCTERCIPKVRDWRVLQRDLGSDHRAIRFVYGSGASITGEKLNETMQCPWKRPSAKAKDMMENLLPQMVQYRRRMATKEDVERFWEVHLMELRRALSKMFPRKKERHATRCYWWNDEVKEAYKRYQVARRNVRIKEKRSGPRWEEGRNDQRLLRGRWRYQIKMAKLSSWREFASNLSNPWSGLHKILRAVNIGKARYSTLADTEGNYGEDILCTLQMLGRQFFPSLPEEQESHRWIEGQVEKQLENWEEGPPIGHIEFQMALKKMATSSAPGMDGITSNIIRILCQHGWETQYRMMYDACIRLAVLPEAWKKAAIILIPKAGANEMTTKSLRPISLTSIHCKLLERIVGQRMTYELENSGMISSTQHAYRKGGSTLTALYEAVGAIEAARARNWVCQAIFLDISGAFDRAWHAGILYELLQYGVSKYLIRWLRAYLDERHATFKAGGQQHVVELEQGCPQGGVLSPLLWNVLFNRFLKITEDGTPAGAPPIQIVGYADDALVLCQAKTPVSATNRLQRFINKIQRWSEQYRVVFNPAKICSMTFGKVGKRRKAGETSGIIFNGVGIKQVEQYKYLGITLDHRLTWKPHIACTLDKLTKINRMLRGAVRESWGVKSGILRILYEGLFKPVMLYGVAVWASGAKSKSVCKKFDKVIREFAVMATRTFRTSAQNVVLQLMGIQSFADAVESELMRSSLLQLQLTGNYRRDQGGVAVGRMNEALKRSWTSLDAQIYDVRHADLMNNYETHPRNWFQIQCRYTDRLSSLWNSVETSGWILCTDASSSTYGKGWAVAVFRHGFLIKVLFGSLTNATVFTTELYAIYKAAEEVRNLEVGYQETVEIRSDSLSCIRALESSIQTDPNLRTCWGEFLKRSREGYRLKLRWVPSHEGVEGNELADSIARRAVDSRQTAAMQTTARDLKRLISKKEGIRAESIFAGTQSKVFKMLVPNRASLMALQKDMPMGSANQLLTGHCRLNHFLSKIGVMNDAACQCGAADETPEHYLCECPEYKTIRSETWGNEEVNMGIVRAGGWSNLRMYIQKTKRLENPSIYNASSTSSSAST